MKHDETITRTGMKLATGVRVAWSDVTTTAIEDWLRVFPRPDDQHIPPMTQPGDPAIRAAVDAVNSGVL